MTKAHRLSSGKEWVEENLKELMHFAENSPPAPFYWIPEDKVYGVDNYGYFRCSPNHDEFERIEWGDIPKPIRELVEDSGEEPTDSEGSGSFDNEAADYYHGGNIEDSNE